jgi:quinol monooxygenase YgiN
MPDNHRRFRRELRRMTHYFTSGSWYVTPGCEDQFIERWKEMVSWSRKNFPAMHEASLLRDDNLPGHFLSFAEWDNPDESKAWKTTTGFQERFKACAAICDKARGADYDRVAAV